MTNPDTLLVQRARELYGAAARHVDPAVAARLRRARLHALAAAREERPMLTRHWWLPSGAFAVVALAAVMLWQPLQQAPGPATATPPSAQVNDADNDLPPDAAQMDPKLYQNLDFYGWLASNDSAMGRP